MESHDPHAHLMTSMRRVDLEAMEFVAGSPYAFESTKGSSGRAPSAGAAAAVSLDGGGHLFIRGSAKGS